MNFRNLTIIINIKKKDLHDIKKQVEIIFPDFLFYQKLKSKYKDFLSISIKRIIFNKYIFLKVFSFSSKEEEEEEKKGIECHIEFSKPYNYNKHKKK